MEWVWIPKLRPLILPAIALVNKQKDDWLKHYLRSRPDVLLIRLINHNVWIQSGYPELPKSKSIRPASHHSIS